VEEFYSGLSGRSQPGVDQAFDCFLFPHNENLVLCICLVHKIIIH
jgi:hypothetical protein